MSLGKCGGCRLEESSAPWCLRNNNRKNGFVSGSVDKLESLAVDVTDCSMARQRDDCSKSVPKKCTKMQTKNTFQGGGADH